MSLMSSRPLATPGAAPSQGPALNLYYLYIMETDKLVRKIVDRYGCHLMFANEHAAHSRADHEALNLPVSLGAVVWVSTKHNLHLTRAGIAVELAGGKVSRKAYRSCVR